MSNDVFSIAPPPSRGGLIFDTAQPDEDVLMKDASLEQEWTWATEVSVCVYNLGPHLMNGLAAYEHSISSARYECAHPPSSPSSSTL